MKVELNKEECDLLTQLMGTSKDDPRIHGLIGTCFWSLTTTARKTRSNSKILGLRFKVS